MFNSCHLLRTTCLSALILCLVLLPYGVAQEEPALAVTVIAVTSFKHGPDSGSNLKISQEIDAAAEHLRAFFEKHYKVPVRVLKSPEQTTSSAIRTFLFDDLPYDSRRVHLLFVLSHGMAKSYPNSPANSELFIASSDTDDQQPEAGAIRGEELLSGIGHLANGTSAFLFVDTCNSAAIGSFAARLSDLATSQATLSRTMVLASSLEDQYSFNARFTEALLRVWSSPEGRCSATARDISSTLAAAMHQVDPASHATAQDVSLALRYETVRDFCVESFMTSHALLILSNASYNSAWVSFTPDDSDIGVINVPPRSVVPVLLSRSSYKIVISKNSDPGVVPDRFSEVNLDFTGDFVKVQPVTEVPSVEARDPEVLAATNQKAADLLEAWESTSRSAVLALRLTAKAAYEESLRQNEKQIADLSASLPASRQDIDKAKQQVALDSEAANRATQELAERRGSGQAIGTAAGVAGVTVTDRGVHEMTIQAARAQSKLESSVEMLNQAEVAVLSKETSLNKARVMGRKEQQALNDLSFSLVKAQIFQEREQRCSDSVKRDLSSVGSFRQAERGATLFVEGSDSLTPMTVRKVSAFLIANSAITLELEYVVAGNAKSSAEYQTIAEARLKMIHDQLLRLGIPSSKLFVRGYGLQGPARKQFRLVFSPTRG